MAVICVVFDADGVVINFEYFTIELEKKCGISHEKVQPFFTDKFNDCLIGKKDLKKEIQPYLKEWGWEKSVDEFLKFWFKTEDRPNQKIINYIKNLHDQNIKTILATNQEKYRTKFMTEKMKFNEVFHEIISSADAKSKKPQQEFFLFVYKKIKKKYNFKKEEIIFWDDIGKNVTAGNEFGFQSFQYKNFNDFKKTMSSLFDKSS